ncbi:MAG: dihydrofolate reductase [Roseiarcus sp.]
MSAPRLALIAAVARNGVIGAGDALPWRLSSDLKRFKTLTMGKPLVMGRKTFQAIGRALPGREIIVVTRDEAYAPEGVEVARDIDAALRRAEVKAGAAGVDEVVVAGGGEIYAQTIARAGRLYVTEVDLAPEGDARFPRIDPALWREVRREPGERGPRDEANFAFVEYRRVP